MPACLPACPASLTVTAWPCRSELKDTLSFTGAYETVTDGKAADHAAPARREAAKKLIMNHERVLHDLTRTAARREALGRPAVLGPSLAASRPAQRASLAVGGSPHSRCVAYLPRSSLAASSRHRRSAQVAARAFPRPGAHGAGARRGHCAARDLAPTDRPAATRACEATTRTHQSQPSCHHPRRSGSSPG